MKPFLLESTPCYGIIRHPYAGVWSAFIKFAYGATFDEFWKNWYAHAPNDQEMLDGCEILRFEDGPEKVWGRIQEITQVDAPRVVINESHKKDQPKQDLTEDQKKDLGILQMEI